MTPELISLPWKIQIALGAGYAAYLMAYLGLRKHHTASDVFFKTIIFSLFASGVFAASLKTSVYFEVALAVAITIGAGLIWNKWLRLVYEKFLRWAGILYDDHLTAWLSVTHDQSNYFTQISVLFDDGSSLECRDLSKFKNAPLGPAVLGADGDVAMYTTHSINAKGVVKELKSTKDHNYGDRITYIPREKIARVNFRKKSKT